MAALAFLFSFRGTADRRAAVMVWLASFIVSVGVVVLGALAPHIARYFFPVLTLSAVALLTTSARRLHHAGHSGRWAVLTLIPLIGVIAGGIIAFLPQRRMHLLAHNGPRMVGYGGIVLLMMMGFWRVWWTPYWVPSESMKPALLVGDYVIVRAVSSGADVARGDVIVLRHPVKDEVQIKRVIAVAGDIIAVSGGVVWLNGAPLQQLPMGTFTEVMEPQGPLALRPRCENGLVGDGSLCRKTMLREVLPGGRSYGILNILSGSAGDDMAQIQVPAGALFVLGDNRDNSFDSRFHTGVGGIGILAQTQVLGVARRVVFSSASAQIWAFWTWRGGRFLQAVEG